MADRQSPPGVLGIITEENVSAAMRDGVKLQAHVFRPDAPGAYPALLARTPYGRGTGGYERLVRAGYAVITQDTRGRYGSEGRCQLFTVPNTGDAEDGYDSVEWVARQPWCNGRVGTFGASYSAWMQWQLAKLRPPHLLAMCAYTIPLEVTELDYPGGLRVGRRVKWWLTTMAPDFRKRQGLPPPHTTEEARRMWDDVEHGRWLYHLPWIDLPKYLPDDLAEQVRRWLENPASEPWGFRHVHREVEVPNLDFSGWYDHCNGTMGHLALMQRHGRTPVARQQTRLVIGPWNHPGLGQRQLGPVDFGPQAQLDLTDMMIRWFDRWLKGADNGVDHEPAVRYFVMGSGRWKQADTWPPPDARMQPYYLDGETLDPRKPAQDSIRDYIYDPVDPVPTLWDRKLFTVPSDRRELNHRTDILRFRTPPLQADVEVVGEPRAVLFISSSAPDTDFFARLVDEHSDGRTLDICYGMIRARHRRGLDHNDPLIPGEVTELTIILGPTACRFLKGHRIHLEITSSDFPNHDRNHNTGGNDLKDTTLVSARQRVYMGGDHASNLVLPCMT